MPRCNLLFRYACVCALALLTAASYLLEGSEEFTYPVSSATRIFEHTCSASPGLETTLVVTELQ
jgi:hypothetical protein